jgi:hypothetical protein
MRSTRQSRISPALTGDAGEPGHSSWLDVVYDLFGGIIEWRYLSSLHSKTAERNGCGDATPE